MRFWPFKKKVETKPVELTSSDDPPPAYLQAAFDEAVKRPLDDMVWRLVIASPQRYIIIDLGVLTMSSYCETHEKQGLQAARLGGAQVLNVVFEENLPVAGEWPDWAGAQKDMERALSLGPNTLITLHHNAVILHRVGRLKEAIAAQRKATEVEPLGSYIWANLAAYLMEDGQLEAARVAYGKALEISPENVTAAQELAIVDLLEGHATRTLAAMEKLPRGADRLMGSAIAQHDLGHGLESQRALDQLVALGDGEPDIAYRIASVHAWRDERDSAFEWLNRAYVRRDFGLRLVKVDPILRNLRRDARYAAFLKKMNLPVD